MNPVERLIEADRVAPKRILVVGDSMIDRWVYGTVSESQDGCPKHVQSPPPDPIMTPGGAAGAARQLNRWNAKVFLASAIVDGGLPLGVSHSLMKVNCRQYSFPSRRLPVKCRYMEGDRIVFRADHEDAERYGLSEAELREAREKVVQAVTHCQFAGVLISDYDKGFLDPETIQRIIKACQEQDVPVVADAKREPKVYEGAVLKCNREYAHVNHLHAEIVEHIPCSVITYGWEPPIYWHEHTAFRPRYPKPDQVGSVNHVGAGDAFAAHLVLALAHGLTLEEAAAVAHSAGRVYVTKRHGEPPTPQEILADFTLPLAP